MAAGSRADSVSYSPRSRTSGRYLGRSTTSLMPNSSVPSSVGPRDFFAASSGSGGTTLRVWQSGHLISWPIFSIGASTRVPHRWQTTATSLGFGFCLGGGGGRRLGSTRLSGFGDCGVRAAGCAALGEDCGADGRDCGLRTGDCGLTGRGGGGGTGTFAGGGGGAGTRGTVASDFGPPTSGL